MPVSLLRNCRLHMTSRPAYFPSIHGILLWHLSTPRLQLRILIPIIGWVHVFDLINNVFFLFRGLILCRQIKEKTEADMQTGTRHNTMNHEKTNRCVLSVSNIPRKYWTRNTLFWFANASYRPPSDKLIIFGRNKCVT